MGIEPTYSAWEADVLPLNYTRSAMCRYIALPLFMAQLRCNGLRDVRYSRSDGSKNNSFTLIRHPTFPILCLCSIELNCGVLGGTVLQETLIRGPKS